MSDFRHRDGACRGGRVERGGCEPSPRSFTQVIEDQPLKPTSLSFELHTQDNVGLALHVASCDPSRGQFAAEKLRIVCQFVSHGRTGPSRLTTASTRADSSPVPDKGADLGVVAHVAQEIVSTCEDCGRAFSDGSDGHDVVERAMMLDGFCIDCCLI